MLRMLRMLKKAGEVLAEKSDRVTYSDSADLPPIRSYRIRLRYAVSGLVVFG